MPIIGGIAFSVLHPFFVAGLIMGLRDAEQGGRLRIGHLLAGFRAGRETELLKVGLVWLFMYVVSLSLGVVLGDDQSWRVMLGDHAAVEEFSLSRDPSFWAIQLFNMSLSVPIVMLTWFAPALIALHDLDAVRAMKLSFVATLRNVKPFLMYGTCYVLLGLLPVVILFVNFAIFQMVKGVIVVLLGLLSMVIVIGVMVLIFMLIPVLIASVYVSYKDIFSSPQEPPITSPAL